jgi:hypothetical protein
MTVEKKYTEPALMQMDSAVILRTLLMVAVSMIVNAFVGKYIWNNVLVNVISGVKKVSMSEIVLLHVLFSILICRC